MNVNVVKLFNQCSFFSFTLVVTQLLVYRIILHKLFPESTLLQLYGCGQPRLFMNVNVGKFLINVVSTLH